MEVSLFVWSNQICFRESGEKLVFHSISNFTKSGKKKSRQTTPKTAFSFDYVLTYVCKAKCRYLAQMLKYRGLRPQAKTLLKIHIQRHICSSLCSEIGVQAPTTGTEHLEFTNIVGEDTATYLASPAFEGHQCAAIPMSSFAGSQLTYFKLSQILVVNICQLNSPLAWFSSLTLRES